MNAFNCFMHQLSLVDMNLSLRKTVLSPFKKKKFDFRISVAIQ